MLHRMGASRSPPAGIRDRNASKHWLSGHGIALARCSNHRLHPVTRTNFPLNALGAALGTARYRTILCERAHDCVNVLFAERLREWALLLERAAARRLDNLTISFDYEGEITAQDTEEILGKIAQLDQRAHEAAEIAKPERAQALRLFAASLEKAFYGFGPDFLQQNPLRIVDDAVSVIKGSIELWPTLVEICYFQKDRMGHLKIRVQNQKK
jgi:hypothetical protein